ncbi:2OG-Fe(II) oxygenase [Niveispirillum sp. KHB5.9]|uniref:2OG-Fe(II) oxygenase n=1 Tax=Niveispirillum sp. KHB5.9 TaxID=3400269 RepID=UPI003A8C4B13
MDLPLSTPVRPGIGEPAPWFAAPSGDVAQFHFASLGGRNVVLCFHGTDITEAEAATDLLTAWAEGMNERHVVSFAVVTNDRGIAARFRWPRLRLFRDDPSGSIAQAYGIGPEGGWVVVDTLMRVLMRAPLSAGAAVLVRVATLPPAGLMASMDAPAPVLAVPGIFEPEFCRQLIALYQAHGGADSGFMREKEGRTVGTIDHGFKRRRDMIINDQAVIAAARTRIERRLLPMIIRALQFRTTRMERYIVACYDAAEQGFFRAHRDNTTRGTAHRRLAVSINLNAEEFEGGELCFPEFSPRTYRPTTGGAVVFSCSMLHEAQPVTRGTRYAFLPFLYDEAGAKLREANARFLTGETEIIGPSASAHHR